MISDITLNAFVDELQKIAFNESFLARKILTSKGRQFAGVTKPPSRPPPVPPQAVGKARSMKLTPGSQRAAAAGDRQLGQVEQRFQSMA